MLPRAFIALRAVSSLHSKDFRWFMTGRMAASGTIQLCSVAQGWLVYSLTGSALALGWVSTASALAALFLAPLGGIVADRFEKRTVLIWTRVALILSAFAVALLIFSGQIQLWHITIVAVIDTAIFSFMMPAQETIYSDLVERGVLLNAVSLNAVSEGLFGILSALLAGLLIESVGAGGVYLVMGLLFSFAGFTHLKLPTRPQHMRPSRSTRAQSAFVDGLHYLKGHHVMIVLMVLVSSVRSLCTPFEPFCQPMQRTNWV